MALDPIGTPRRYASAQQSITPSDGLGAIPTGGVWSNGGSRAPSVAGTVDGNDHNEEHIQRLRDRYTFCKSADNLKNNLLEEMLSRYTNLIQEHEALKRAKAIQQADDQAFQLQAYKEHTDLLYNLLTRAAFVMVLIDGDGMIFNSELLRLGEEGGKKAARHLMTSVSEFIREMPGCPSEVRISARVYANTSGLGQACMRAGIVSSPSMVQDFFRGFTCGEELFDFVDVGAGKDRADGKMNANLKMYLHDYQCRHILFGCSHDNGFARTLEKFVHEKDVLTKLTLLEGVPFEKELLALPYARHKFPGLFRDTKIVNKLDLITDFPRGRQDSLRNQEAMRNFNPNSAVFTPPSHTPAPPITPLFSPKTTAPSEAVSSGRGDLTRTNSLSSLAFSEAPSSGTPVGGGWANIARGSKNLPFKDLTKKESEPPKYIGPVVFLNKNGQRIDKTMDYDHDKVYKLKQIKLCNQHYIGRGCCHHNASNHACPHRHDLNLSKDDLKWLRVVARETVCKKGTNCRELDCIYGHHCPYPKNNEGSMRGIGCINGENCRFAREMHGMDVKVAETLTKNDLELYDEEDA